MFSQYYRPQSIGDALSILEMHEGRARVLAGGTDLVVQLNRREIAFEAAVDITAINEMRYIREEGGKIKIGALATHTDLAESPLLHKNAPFLADAARSIGSLQIRNVATVGGNIVNAQPGADTAVTLLALDAVATLLSPAGTRQVPCSELYHPGGGSTVNPAREILAEFSFYPPLYSGGSGSFGRVARRKALALPVFNTAVVLRASSKTRLDDVRIIMAPVAPIPFRAREAERVLLNNTLDENTFREAAAVASREANPRDSVFRGSSAYRKKLAGVIVCRTLAEAWENMLFSN